LKERFANSLSIFHNNPIKLIMQTSFSSMQCQTFPKDKPIAKQILDLRTHFPMVPFQQIFTLKNHLLIICQIYAEIISNSLGKPYFLVCRKNIFIEQANYTTTP